MILHAPKDKLHTRVSARTIDSPGTAGAVARFLHAPDHKTRAEIMSTLPAWTRTLLVRVRNHDAHTALAEAFTA